MTEESFYQTGIPDRVVRMELISFFSIYTDTLGSLEDVSKRISRNEKQVERQLEKLVQLHILKKEYEDGEPRYRHVRAISPELPRRGNGVKHAGSRVSGLKGYKLQANQREENAKASVRLKMAVAAGKRRGWKEYLELLMDTVNRVEGVSCAAYLLNNRHSEVVWNCKRGVYADKPGVADQNDQHCVVIERELIRNTGLLDNDQGIKYLYPLNDDEAILICVNRAGSYCIDTRFLGSLFEDFMPIVAEKRRLNLKAEKNAEIILGESIYWSIINNPDIYKGGMDGMLASLAKCVQAGRVSMLVHDEQGLLRTYSTYGVRKNLDMRGGSFPVGKGVAGWCVENGNTANVIDARLDPRFISNHYNDIETMLCSPMIAPGGGALGAICAVNKVATDIDRGSFFEMEDERLLDGTAQCLARAICVLKYRGNQFVWRISPPETSNNGTSCEN